jgi:DNA-binding response OmpR family regulator
VKLCALLDSGKIEDIENCYEAGADLCILKPFNIKSFINKLHNLSNRKTQMPEFDDTFNQFESDDLLRCKALISAILKN